jgi:HSP20 family protein
VADRRCKTVYTTTIFRENFSKDNNKQKGFAMLVTRYNPTYRDGFTRGFDLVNRLLNEMPTKENDDAAFSPSVNIREEENAYFVEVDLPGVAKEDIAVDVEDNRLTISGEKKFKEEIKEDNYNKIESFYGSFKRVFDLPDTIDTEKIEAKNDNGVLEVTLPKLPKEEIIKSKRVTIS